MQDPSENPSGPQDAPLPFPDHPHPLNDFPVEDEEVVGIDPNYNKPPSTNPGLAGNPNEDETIDPVKVDGEIVYENLSPRMKRFVDTIRAQFGVDYRADVNLVPTRQRPVKPRGIDGWNVLDARAASECKNEGCRGCQMDALLYTAIMALSEVPGWDQLGGGPVGVYGQLVRLTFVKPDGYPYQPPTANYNGLATMMREHGLRGGEEHSGTVYVGGPDDLPPEIAAAVDKAEAGGNDNSADRALIEECIAKHLADIGVKMEMGPGGEARMMIPPIRQFARHLKDLERRRSMDPRAEGNRTYSFGATPGTGKTSEMLTQMLGRGRRNRRTGKTSTFYDEVQKVDDEYHIDPAVHQQAIANGIKDLAAQLRVMCLGILSGGAPTSEAWLALTQLADAGDDIEMALKHLGVER